MAHFMLLIRRGRDVTRSGTPCLEVVKMPQLCADSALDQNNDYFSAKAYENILCLRFKGNLLRHSINLRCRDQIIGYLHRVSNAPSINVVLILNPVRASKCGDYTGFYKMVWIHRFSEDDVLRMCRSFDQYILEIINSEKFFISADSGRLFPQLFDLTLACDYRIIADNTRFQNAFLKLGMIPKGGAAFFLNERVGHCKAYELLLSDTGFDAEEAKQLGIVNEVVPLQDLKRAAVKRARYFANKPIATLRGLKKMLSYPMKDLADYLENETQELIHILRPHTDW